MQSFLNVITLQTYTFFTTLTPRLHGPSKRFFRRPQNLNAPRNKPSQLQSQTLKTAAERPPKRRHHIYVTSKKKITSRSATYSLTFQSFIWFYPLNLMFRKKGLKAVLNITLDFPEVHRSGHNAYDRQIHSQIVALSSFLHSIVLQASFSH